jgi:hypothetical protein
VSSCFLSKNVSIKLLSAFFVHKNIGGTDLEQMGERNFGRVQEDITEGRRKVRSEGLYNLHF